LDKNTVTGLVLIFILMAAWFYVTMPTEEELARQRQQQALQDSLQQLEQVQEDTVERQPQVPVEDDPLPSLTRQEKSKTPVGLFAQHQATDTTEFIVETPLYKAVFTNLGAGPSKFTLKDFDTWDGRPVQMITDTTRSAYNIGFLSTENYNVDTKNLLFERVSPLSSAYLEEGESRELKYALQLPDGRQLVYTYTFYSDSYQIDLDIEFIGLGSYVVGRSIDFGWEPPLNPTEADPTQDGMITSAYVYAGGELEQFKLDEPGVKENTINGTIDWAATRTKFFAQIIKPVSNSDAVFLEGAMTGPSDDPLTKYHYQVAIQSNIPQNSPLSYQLYIGPLKYDVVKTFDEHAYDMVEVSYAWLRWFSDPFVRFIVIPFFNLLSGFMSNYGLIIVIFAAGVKLILSPLTMKSYKSMAAMKELQPKMKEIQEKYKDDPQKQQKAVMNMYKKEGVNPLGGCLPNLLQFPILITLWRFFQNSILLRQEEFLWVSDLSAPDYILDLPFSIPFLGDQLAGMVLLMSGTMIAQMQLTGGMSGGGAPTNPQMKIFQYFLPIMLLFIFNNFASGLSLYYLIFNLLSIVQQLYINKSLHAEKEGAVAKS